MAEKDKAAAPETRIFTLIVLGGAAIAAMVAAYLFFLAPPSSPGDARRAIQPDDKRWVAVAPGRVEPWSGEIRLSAAAVGPVGEVMVKPNDRVVAGEILVRLQDDEMKARLAIAETQVALRLRARNDQSVSGKAADRRKAEDQLAEAEKAVTDARDAFDRAVADKRNGSGEVDIFAARTAWLQAQERARQRRADMKKLEADKDIPLPSALEGQLSIARNELAQIDASIEKLIVRAPITGSVLQVNAKPGELASPSAPQPLVIIGDTSALRVRAELDERDVGAVKVGQSAVVRASAFPGRDFAGKVSAIAPVVEPGRSAARGQRNLTDVDVAEVMVDLAEPGSLVVGMKVDVYFYGK
jgi:HlyD family secretion protein